MNVLHPLPDRQPTISRATNPRGVPVSRFVSVDMLRGLAIFCIVGMEGIVLALRELASGHSHILASVITPLANQFIHSHWEGFRFYDLVFPLFIFTAGVAIPMSLPSRVARHGKAATFAHLARRAALLFLIGVLCSGVLITWPQIRFFGILQRIAICYVIASLFFLHTGQRTIIAASVALLVGYWALLAFVPVPGFGFPIISETANLPIWVDENYLPGRKSFGTWDSEGLLGTFPAIATCLIGVLSGAILINSQTTDRYKTGVLIGLGAAIAMTGWIWGFWFPIIKWIWTSPFVLVSTGICMMMLGIAHHIVDVQKTRGWLMVFSWLGTNAMLLFVVQQILTFEYMARILVGKYVLASLDSATAPGVSTALVRTLGLCLAIVLAKLLYDRKIFLRV